MQDTLHTVAEGQTAQVEQQRFTIPHCERPGRLSHVWSCLSQRREAAGQQGSGPLGWEERLACFEQECLVRARKGTQVCLAMARTLAPVPSWECDRNCAVHHQTGDSVKLGSAGSVTS